jgi:hypothetical protein
MKHGGMTVPAGAPGYAPCPTSTIDYCYKFSRAYYIFFFWKAPYISGN